MPPAPRSAAVRPLPLALVKGLGDLAATVPYLLGFSPHESVTCVGLTAANRRGGRRVGLTARVDLPAVLDPETAPLLLDGVFDAIARTEALGVIALVATDDPVVDPVVVARLRVASQRSGLELFDVGWHRGETCVSLLCDDPACCPPGGVPVDTACRAAASAAFAGRVALPDRAAVEAEFTATPAGDARALDALIGAEEEVVMRAAVTGDGDDHTALARTARVLDLAAAFDAREGSESQVPALSDAEVAMCVAALADVPVRDSVWLAIDAGAVHGQGLWLELARRAPAPYDASPLFLLGWRCWRHGDGVRALMAAERADATPGGYPAARLLLEAIGAAVDPGAVPSLSA